MIGHRLHFSRLHNRSARAAFIGFGKCVSNKLIVIFSKMTLLAALYYFQIQLHHLLAPFPFWRPLIPLSVALLRCVSFTLARMKNSRRILVHFYLEIVLLINTKMETVLMRGGLLAFSGDDSFSISRHKCREYGFAARTVRRRNCGKRSA